ncbi:MAG: class I SAM-dependent methyltransferase [Limimaricola sp.]|uniref:class I SAM-dependent methyltransferase n=1 Tax=Limimaricola sp. TaxID=2211665 RepID=UPI001D810887|nr:SAM-dependent methyltransferase [Limimaricola sp.]MBI1417829.1 class I SAM-dependent methyltransferase [Limimaricola sp.]
MSDAPLAPLIASRIAADGPMTIAEYMAMCLWHPAHGYYATRDPLGRAGDFITAPEISQMFGELLGLALGQAWLDQGAPDAVVLAELGPGRGTLMADALRALRAVPGFLQAAEVHLVEASPVLRAAQARLVGEATWHEGVADLPDAPLFLIANEFFDALPIRQFQRDGTGWRERVVGLDGKALRIGLSDPLPVPALDERLAGTAEGQVVELAPALPAIAAEIGTRIAARGGAALIIDYGDWMSLGDTLQAVAGHAPADPLARPGEADLTAHVDFAALARAGRPARASRLTAQGRFLERLGIGARAAALAQGMSDPTRASHLAGYRRLTAAEEMGDLFKVMGLFPEGAPPPPGLDV